MGEGVPAVIALAAIGFAGFAILARLLPADHGLQAVAAIVVALLLLAAMRELSFELSKRRERAQRLLFLGKVSAQLAHDLRNPLAALKGALDVVRDGAEQAEREYLFGLMHEQIMRMQSVLESYGRLGRIELEPQRLSVNRLIEAAVAGQTLAHPLLRFEIEAEPMLSECTIDAKLITLAMENLLSNAAQACEAGGVVSVRTSPGATPRAILIQVEDNGRGIPPADQEQVFDEFFTTRRFGSGLGLYFVRRVAHAHGGEVLLQSRVGVGTIVSLCLPTDPPETDERVLPAEHEPAPH
jgi:signal transduction histidine kinase